MQFYTHVMRHRDLFDVSYNGTMAGYIFSHRLFFVLNPYMFGNTPGKWRRQENNVFNWTLAIEIVI